MKYLDDIDRSIQDNVINIKSGYQSRTYRYDLLDKDENFKKTLTNISINKNSISFSGFIDVKRTGTVNLTGLDPDIDFINDRIKIYVTLNDGMNNLTYPLGIYLLSSPVKVLITKDVYNYQVNIYSKTQILIEDKVIARFVIKKGKVYTNVIQELLIGTGIGNIEVTNSGLAANRSFSYDAGSSKLFIINELLKQINYYPIYTDNDGSVIIKPSVLSQERNADFYYRINDESIVQKGLAETLDLFNVPNVTTRVVTNSENEPLVSTYKNYDPQDPTSIPNRGREIDDYQEISDIPDQTTLDEFVLREAEASKKIFGEVRFSSSLNPMHEQDECIEVNGEIFIETSWTMQLSTQGAMNHSARRVVYV